jgi:hypothetical protein
MKILEYDHEPAIGGDRLKEAAPGSECLVSLGHPCPFGIGQPHQGREPTFEPLLLSRIKDYLIDGLGYLAAASAGYSDSRMPTWPLTTSPSAQKVMPSP